MPSGPSTTPGSCGPARSNSRSRTSLAPSAVARDAIRGLGGYIGASNTFNEGDDQPVAEITYRIPVGRWEDALAALRSLNGLTTKVVTEQTNAVEVTGQIVDLDARIRNLRASESALQAIDARATKISDVLEVQAQLTDVRGQIEQLTAQRHRPRQPRRLRDPDRDLPCPARGCGDRPEGLGPDGRRR